MPNEYKVSLNFEPKLIEPISSQVKLHIYRIVREVVQNIIVHSKATNISVTLYNSIDKKLLLTIIDNGVGKTEGFKEGLGLKNIKFRSKLINAYFKYKNNIPEGIIFSLKIPLNDTFSNSR